MIISYNADKSKYSNVWVVAELLSGKVQTSTYELIGAARSLADKRSSQVWVVLMGYGIAGQAQSLFAYGADKVIEVDDIKLSGFIDEIEAKVMIRLIEKYKPEIVIGAATARGRALMPRIAVMSNCGLTADCTELGIDPENGDLLQTRPAFGGNIMATIRCSNHRPQMAIVRPRVMKALDPDSSRTGEVIREFVQDNDGAKIKRIVDIVHCNETTVNLNDAQIIISGGRGMKGPEGFELLKKLAGAADGAVGASRAAVDCGWIPYSHQIGQTGQTVQTKAYIACGISGQIQHLVGMQSCNMIIAIDKNPDTPRETWWGAQFL